MKLQSPATTGGFMLRLKDETTMKSVAFGSSEHEDAGRRPKLVVVYEN